jgi:hypothetical protein
MNIDPKDFGNAALHVPSHMDTVMMPKPMGDTLPLQSRGSLEIQEWFRDFRI